MCSTICLFRLSDQCFSCLYLSCPSSFSSPSLSPGSLSLHGQVRPGCSLKNSSTLSGRSVCERRQEWLLRESVQSITWRSRWRCRRSWNCLIWRWSAFWGSSRPRGCAAWRGCAVRLETCAGTITCGRGIWERNGGRWLGRRQRGSGTGTWLRWSPPRVAPSTGTAPRSTRSGARAAGSRRSGWGLFRGLSCGSSRGSTVAAGSGLFFLMTPSCLGISTLRAASSGSLLRSTIARYSSDR